MSERRKTLRSYLHGERCIVPAPVHDPLSARIAEEIGFPVGVLGGSAAALAVLGAPDLALLTLTELAEQCRRICRASDLPLLVDADHGYGGPLNVRRTVEELEVAGAAAITIEDTNLPAIVTSAGADPLVTLEEGRAKILAALDARRDPELLIVARTSAAATEGTAGAVRRCQAYVDCGADAVFLAGLPSADDLKEIAGHLSVPIISGVIPEDQSTPTELARHGVRLSLRKNLALGDGLQAYHTALLRTAKANGEASPAANIGMPSLDTLTRRSRYEI